jgi:hypothetical protein
MMMRPSVFPLHVMRPMRPGLRGLGTCTCVVAAAAKTGTSIAASAGASAIATAAGAGAVAGPIGIAVGAIVGLVAGDLLNKQYLNVADMNATEANEIAAFNAYRAIMGQAPGRQFGLDAMVAVWKGANHSGLFPLNDQVQCFHEGCSAHPGDPTWIDAAVTGASTLPTFAMAVAAWERNTPYMASGATKICWSGLKLPSAVACCGVCEVTAPTSAAAVKAATVATAAITPGATKVALNGLGALASAFSRPAPVVRTPALLAPTWPPGRLPPVHPAVIAKHNAHVLGRLAGFGATCAASIAPAVTVIDSYFIPQNQALSDPPWAVPTNTTEHQILYDTMDAYLAEYVTASTVPYIADQMAASSAVQPVLTCAASAGVCTAGSTVPPTCLPVTSVASPSCATLPPPVTPMLPCTPVAIASQAGSSTTTAAATAANLNAALAAQGYIYAGTTSQGYPLYSNDGLVYIYENGTLTEFATCAQLAAAGGAANIGTVTTAAATSNSSAMTWVWLGGAALVGWYFLRKKKRA